MKDHDTSKAKGFAASNHFDGMPEKFNRDRDGDGDTNLEEYLNSLCPDPLVK